MSTFMQYAILASHEALQDARWRPDSDQQREMTVSQIFCDVQSDYPAELTIRVYV